jgi:hypothetical protein
MVMTEDLIYRVMQSNRRGKESVSRAQQPSEYGVDSRHAALRELLGCEQEDWEEIGERHKADFEERKAQYARRSSTPEE